jgi:hypothetical protein
VCAKVDTNLFDIAHSKCRVLEEDRFVTMAILVSVVNFRCVSTMSKGC